MDLARSRLRWRQAALALLALWLLTLAGGAYLVLDQGVSLTYLEESCRDATDDLAVMRRLLPAAAPGLARADVLALVRRQNPGAFVTASDTAVTVGQLAFHFDAAGRLARVTHGGAAE